MPATSRVSEILRSRSSAQNLDQARVRVSRIAQNTSESRMRQETISSAFAGASSRKYSGRNPQSR
jgi:hypothetical protein